MDLEIIKIASNTVNNKILDNYTHKANQKNPICGDEMQITIKIKKNKITDFGYQCKSCIYCQASVSLLSRKSINQSLDKIKNLIEFFEFFFEKDISIFPRECSVFSKLFDKKNISRKECLLLPFKTLRKALKS